MSKLINTGSTKLTKVQVPQSQPKIDIPDKISLSRKSLPRSTHSFSFHEIERERLKKLLGKVQKISKKKVTATDIIKGLLIIGEELEENKLIEAIRQSYIEHLDT